MHGDRGCVAAEGASLNRGSMTQILRTWLPVFLALLLIQMGNGLTGSLVSIAGQERAFPPLLQGLILSAFFAGSFAGAVMAPPLIRRTSHGFSAALFTFGLFGSTLGFAVTGDPWSWVVIRMLAGCAITGMFTTVESWLNLSIADSIRARIFSIYILIQLIGLAAGQLLLSARSLGESPLFLVAAMVTALAALAFRTERIEHPLVEAPRKMSFLAILRRAPQGTACIALAGFSWAGLMASGPATLQMMGLSDIDKSLVMSLAVASGMLAQFPAGWLADHMDRGRLLLLLTTVAMVAALLPLMGTGPIMLYAFAIAYGAATFPLYAIGVARTSEELGQDERTSAAALMIVAFNIGAVLAPLAIANVIAVLGPHSYFLLLAAPQSLFALIGLLLLANRKRARS